MLDCCRSLAEVAEVGITLSEFSCLARCNGLKATVFSPALLEEGYDEEKAVERFRNDLRKVSKGEGMMALSYSRKALMMTGDGHFSPIGGFSEVDDMVSLYRILFLQQLLADSNSFDRF